MFMEDWASAWLSREGGWMSKVHEIANFNPITARQIRAECTVLEIAQAWKSKLALSDYAWSDR